MNYTDYIKEFNAEDTEYFKTSIKNAEALDWLSAEIPKLECSDKALEKTYYYRWWVYRKHVKNTPEGYVISEFLPDVRWSGKYNVINAASGHHIAEGRWLKNADKYLWNYLDFFFKYPDEGVRYSSWLIWSAMDLYNVTGNIEISDFINKAKAHIALWEQTHLTESKLFWSFDDRDAMEFSISGRLTGKSLKGARPTLNSYMAGNTHALFKLSTLFGAPLGEYEEKANELKTLMNSVLWRDGFYKAIHPKNEIFSDLANEKTANIPRELIGYIPWYFDLADAEKDGVFKLLTDKTAFYASEGLTTAEQTAPQFLYKADHECLWNGYVWPFGTSQTLTALLRAMQRDSACKTAYTGDFYKLLRQYADMHYIIHEDGNRTMWIDEVGAPFEHEWTSRTILKNLNWPENKGGFERGKDYNHSTFCDIVLSALTGAWFDDSGVHFSPIIPDDLDFYAIDDLYIRGDRYRIEYDKSGNHFKKQGLTIYKNGTVLQ